MCGLVGVAGYISAKEESIFKMLLEIDTIRGPHSTGILAVDARGETKIVKKVGTPWDLYQYKQADDIFKASLCVLLGHNRWATKGKITSRNAHPFEQGHIIGAHNGTLTSQNLLMDHKDFEVDSENIFYSMSQVGVDETIKKTCGAFALTWYDSEQETMNFVRNSERPLFLAESEDKRTVFWASERWMLEVTLSKAGIKYREPFQPEPGQLFTYPIELAFVPKAFKDVYVRPLELHKWPVYQGNSYYYDNSKRSGNTVVPFEKAKEAEGPKKIRPENLIALEKLEFYVAGLQKSSVTNQEYVSCLPALKDCDIELRLYTTDTKTIEWMVNSCNTFSGKVRGFSTVGGDTYCVLDPRTIQEIEQEDPEFAVVFDGHVVSEDEFDVLVAGGCGCCKTIPMIDESEEIVWINEDNFICGDCKDLPIVEEFVKSFDKALEKAVSTKH